MYYLPNSRLPKRKNLLDKFSTFLVLEDSNGQAYCKWRREPSLEKNWQFLQQRDSHFQQMCQAQDEKSLVFFLLKICQSQDRSQAEKDLPQKHLAAYLEFPRYKAVSKRFHDYKPFHQNPQEIWEAYLDIVSYATVNFDYLSGLLKKDNSSSDLETYLELSLTSYIRDDYYQKTKLGKYSCWYELKTASHRKLKLGLQQLGIRQGVDTYLLARDYLFKVYSKSGKRWLEPTPAQYNQAANYLNQHFEEVNQDLASIDRDKFEFLIKYCLQALNLDLRENELNFDEIDEPKINVDLMYEERKHLANPLALIEDDELTEQLEKKIEPLRLFLLNQLNSFSEREQKILQLWYGEGLSTPKIALKIGIDQSTVFRGGQRCVRQLLKAVTQWVKQQSLEVDMEALINLDSYIKEWLTIYYRKQEMGEEKTLRR